MGDLLSRLSPPRGGKVNIGEGATLLSGFATEEAPELMTALRTVLSRAPFRNMVTPGGYRMSVAMTNCGRVGWIADRRGYRYEPVDPETGQPWPPMPRLLGRLAAHAAAAGGYERFQPDSCLINRYESGARLSLHQDRNERDFDAPIVSVSLGLPATFLFGGARRNIRPGRYRLESGDIVVWGGPTRLVFHGVEPLVGGENPLTGRMRINLTFRKAL